MSLDTGKKWFGHPRGLATLFFTEMWERFSYYGMRALLVLFLSAALVDKGMGLSNAEANAIYGLYTAFVYLLALPGGWIADNLWGQRKAVWYGGIVIAMGHFSMAIPSNFTFFMGLVLIVIGTGLLKPNVSTMVGDLYPEGGSRRDAGYSVYYMGINLGAFLGPLLCGYFAENIDWHVGFGLAGIGMVIGLIQYRFTAGYLGEIGIAPKAKEAEDVESGETANKVNKNFAWGLLSILLIGVVIAQWIGWIDLGSAQGVAEALGFIIISIVAAYFLYIFVAGGLTSSQKKKMAAIIVFFIAAAVFWSGFEQAGSSLNLFGKYFTARDLGSFEIPASWFQSVNSFFIILLAPVFGWLWLRLGQRNMDPSAPLKFAFGLILLALGFLVMVGAAKVVANGIAGESQASPFFLILTYLLHTSGELCLSPVGMSTFTKLSPKRYVGQMMGIWFVATSLGNLIAGLVAGRFDFSLFDKSDKALSVLNGADSVTPEMLDKIDRNVKDEIGSDLINAGDLDGMRASVTELIERVSTESLPEMPSLFWSITMFIGIAGLILLLLHPIIKKWMGNVR